MTNTGTATRAAYSIDAQLLDEWVELPSMGTARSSHGCGVTDKMGNDTSSKQCNSAVKNPVAIMVGLPLKAFSKQFKLHDHIYIPIYTDDSMSAYPSLIIPLPARLVDVLFVASGIDLTSVEEFTYGTGWVHNIDLPEVRAHAASVQLPTYNGTK